MHYLVKTNWLKQLIMLICVSAIVFALLIGYSAINAPYEWSMGFNAFYYTVMHILWVFSNAIAIFMIFCGGFTFTRSFMGRPFFIGAGKLCFVTALISPIMIQLIYTQMPEGLFLAMVGVNAYAIGNVICILFVGMVLYLAFEFPMRRLLEWSVISAISNDKAKHSYFVELFQRIRNRVGSYGPQDKDKGALDTSVDDLVSSNEDKPLARKSVPHNINRTVDNSTLSDNSPLLR